MRVVVLFVTAVSGWAQSAHEAIPDVALGKRIFESQCTVCHGQGGTGGRGPALTRPKLTKTPDEAAIRRAIAEGLPPEMPGSWQLSVREVASVAAYVKSLGAVAPERLPGDAAGGEALFRAQGCGSCHIVAGAGQSRGPELTAVGAKRNAAFLRRAIVEPAADLPENYLVVEVIPTAGKTIRGVRAAEDPFTLQVRDSASGAFHSFRKSALKQVRVRKGESTMPPYKALSASQLEDLVAYLATLRGEQK